MAEGDVAARPSRAAGNFLTEKIGPLPAWGWGLAAAAVAAAYLWWRNSQSASSSSSSSAGTGSLPLSGSSATSTELAAAGLYQPPSVTYDLGGPSYGSGVSPAPQPVQGQPIPPPNKNPSGDSGPVGIDQSIYPGAPVITPSPAPVGKPAAAPTPVAKIAPTQQSAPQPRYVTVNRWPGPGSTLSSIASENGISLSRIEALNPGIRNPNLIYTGQSVRVS